MLIVPTRRSPSGGVTMVHSKKTRGITAKKPIVGGALKAAAPIILEDRVVGHMTDNLKNLHIAKPRAMPKKYISFD